MDNASERMSVANPDRNARRLNYHKMIFIPTTVLATTASSMISVCAAPRRAGVATLAGDGLARVGMFVMMICASCACENG